MRPFHFSLEKVHKFRQAVEKQRKRELAEARQQQEEEERLLRQYREEKDRFQEMADSSGEETKLGDLWQRELYLQVLEAKVAWQEEKV
ncbi:MAG: hypothetical protein ACPLQP_11380, partial [Moorellaceae bacterium]